MINKIEPEELRVGMYVCGMERVAGKPIFFMNNIRLKTQGDLDKMLGNGYTYVYIVVDEPAVIPEEQAIAAQPAVEETKEQSVEYEAPVEAPEDIIEPVEAIEACPEPLSLEPEPPAAIEEQVPVIDEACVEAAPVETPAPEEEAPPAEEAGQPGDVEPIAPEPVPTSFEEELKEAKKVRDEAELLVREFLHDARLGKGVAAEKVTGTVGKMVDSVFRNQDALTSLARLKSFDDYTFAHSVNVCILSLALGRHMGLERAELCDLGTGAILHDIGKMLVPGQVLNKPGKLTDEEFTIMKRHTEFGGEVLKDARINEASRLVATQHHERFDGSGYYRRLSGRDIHPFARIAAVADVYDAMTSNRVYQNGMPPEEALKRLYLMRGTHFESELVERLIKCLGIYPIGTLVELNTGELAIVKMVNRSHPLQPRIEIILDRKKKRCEPPVETNLMDEIGRWIVGSRSSDELPVFAKPLAS